MLFLCAQLASILYAPFIPTKFFCWAPYDQHTRYAIEVTVAGRALSTDEVAKRYRYPQTAWEVRDIQNVISIVRRTGPARNIVPHYEIPTRLDGV